MLKGICLVARNAIKEHVQIPTLKMMDQYHRFWIRDVCTCIQHEARPGTNLWNYWVRVERNHLKRKIAIDRELRYLETF